jgi:antitoxin component YwqK of YwqJK toxin-antitoxin module
MYSKNGNILSFATQEMNIREIYIYENGKIKSRGTYENGKLVGELTTYPENKD